MHDRYLEEVVLGYGLCPWAERVLRQGRMRRCVLTDSAPAAEAAFPFIDAIEHEGLAGGDPGSGAADIGFLIYPRLSLGAAAFDGYAERLRRADLARRGGGERPRFLMAAFHPFGAEQFTTPFQMVSFVRRTPDPTIQLVRAELLERVRAEREDVSGEIARQNYAEVQGRGVAPLDALLRDIRRERDARYGALG